MKRLTCILMVFCLFLSGCSVGGEWIKEPVVFYYIRSDYRKDMETVIMSEVREASGHREDISYLLALYSLGPSSEDLKSPLPRNTKITLTEHTDDSIRLELSDNVLTMADAEFTLASACLALTCMELSDIRQITVACGDKYTTIGQDNLLLENAMIQNSQEETK